MFSRINFSYKNSPENSKNSLILRDEIVKNNNKKSLTNCIKSYAKAHPNKIQNVGFNDISKLSNTNIIDNVFQQEIIDYHHANNSKNIEIKLRDSSSINSGIIDDVNKPEIILTDEQIIDYHDANNSKNIEIKLRDSSSINTKIFENFIEEEIILTEEQIIQLEAMKNKYINDLSKPIEEGNFDVDSEYLFIEKILERNIYSEMDDNTPLPFNVDRIRKRGIKIFNHVYQSKYEFGKENGTGLGDFLRGCYFILEFCETYNFQSKFIFNNCISKFLLIKTHNLERFDNVLKGVSICKNNNFREFVVENNGIIKDPLKDTKNMMADFVDYIVKLPQYSGNIFMYCIAFPINEIPEKNKEHMRKFLEPTNEMQLTINQTLHDLNISSKQYIVIHIRAGDSYLKEENDSFTNGYIRDLINNIKNDVNRDNNYLLMADNNDVKKIIQKYFPNFKTLMNPITHFGEGAVLEEEKVKNTLVDFYLLSHSKSIFSYSAYKHGSGFSYWCAKTFNIPYVCKYVK